LTNQDFVDFFANEFMQKMVMTGKKEEIKNDYKQNAKYGDSNYAFKKTIKISFKMKLLIGIKYA
jgi:hypothetical protein